ncbi:hypothetical protein [Streptomyces sp. MUSC 14]|uniref:hypothetical protein n=1 Tax=Streptomyces sp. MUSC 14 TaxID=1354889 RepID=UPI00210BD864|nr:hypothetical protein [Streptomyces sp. MUSC 14]
MTNPDMVFSADPRHGLVARSGWEKEEARTVLRDLGWEWAEELHALVPPDDVPEIDAAVQAVAELHLHGHLTGYAVGPYGTTRLTLTRAEQVFTKLVTRDAAEVQPLETGQEVQQTASRQRLGYGRNATTMETFAAETPDSPAI